MMVNSELAIFIKQHTATKERLSESTRLVEDLHLDEEQAIILINDFAEKFEIDTSGFDFQMSINLTLGNLERAIATGYLNDSIISIDDKDPNMPLEFTVKNSIIGIIIGIIAALLLCYVAFYV